MSDHVYYRWTRSTYRATVDRYIGRPMINRYIDRLSADMQRSTAGQVAVKYRSSSGQVSVEDRSRIGQVSVKCRSSICQVSVKYRPSIGQVSAKYRFTYRPYRSEENRLRKSARFFRYMFRFGNGKIHCKVGRSCVTNVVP